MLNRSRSFQKETRTAFLSLVGACSLFGYCNAVSADTINLGTAGQYTVLGINGGDVSINDSAGTINGNVGIGPGETASSLQKITITGNLNIDKTAGSVDLSNLATDLIINGSLNNGLTNHTTSLAQAATDANNASAFYASLAGTNLGAVSSNLSLTASATNHTNVYNISSISYNGDTLTLTGTASDIFILNITGDFNWAQSTVALIGISANQVLFNLIGTDGGLLNEINKSATIFNGIVLGVDRTIRYHNQAVFNGNIIGENITIDSAASMTGVSMQTAVPLPASVWSGLALLGSMGLVGFAKRRRKFST